jgi:hypothetical protein
MSTLDPLAIERFRTILTDIVDHAADDAYEGGAALDVTGVVEQVLTALPGARFQLALNENGVKVRRLVIHGEWEVNPAPASETEAIAQRFLHQEGVPAAPSPLTVDRCTDAACPNANIPNHTHWEQVRRYAVLARLMTERRCPNCGLTSVPPDHLCTLV